MSKRIKVVAVTTAFILASAGIANASPAEAPQASSASTQAREIDKRASFNSRAVERQQAVTKHHLAAKKAAKERAKVRLAAKAASERKKKSERSSRSQGRSLPQGTSSSNQRLGKQMAASRGWTGEQWGCLRILWIKESGWSTSSTNGGSAWGIPQALPGSKMAKAGSDWRTNPATQIEWGLGYIKGRYGSPCGAWSHFQSYNWY